ncbi:hypothetical protein MTO96_015865 [Rhipicephalus appendiculatus]
MTRTERALDECPLVAGDSQIIEVQLAKHKVLMNDIQAHQGSVDTLNRAGHQLIEDGHSEDASVTQTKLADLNGRCNALQDKPSERQQQLAAALREAQAFNREIQEFLMWLSDSGGQPASSKPVGGRQATLAKPRGKCRVPCGIPTIVLMLTFLSPSAPVRICPTGGVHHDAVRNRHELVNHTCGLPKFPSFLDSPLDGHRFSDVITE